VGVGVALVVVGGTVVVGGGVVVVAAVVGGWTAGSGFSPQPATAPAPSVPTTSTSADRRRLTASGSVITAGTVTKAFSDCLAGYSRIDER
jgi:hypothetical protein